MEGGMVNSAMGLLVVALPVKTLTSPPSLPFLESWRGLLEVLAGVLLLIPTHHWRFAHARQLCIYCYADSPDYLCEMVIVCCLLSSTRAATETQLITLMVPVSRQRHQSLVADRNKYFARGFCGLTHTAALAHAGLFYNFTEEKSARLYTAL